MTLKQRLNRLEGQNTAGTASFWDFVLGEANEDDLDTEGRETLQRYLEIKHKGPQNIVTVTRR